MNKQLFDFTKGILLKYRNGGAIKASVLSERLYFKFGFGHLIDDQFKFSFDERSSFIWKIKKEYSLDLIDGEFPIDKSRSENALTSRSEKRNSQTVTKPFILVNSLNNFLLNKTVTQILSIKSLGTYLDLNEIKSIEHEKIILVENLEIMGSLNKLRLPQNLLNALWIYRGDLKNEQSIGTAIEFFKGLSSKHELICFSDFDPAGIQIALTCGAQKWLAPNLNQCEEMLDIKLEGMEEEWDKQQSQIIYLNKLKSESKIYNKAFNMMKLKRKTFKQEHMLAHNISLELSEL